MDASEKPALNTIVQAPEVFPPLPPFAQDRYLFSPAIYSAGTTIHERRVCYAGIQRCHEAMNMSATLIIRCPFYLRALVPEGCASFK